jgi:hypothetical protein
MIGSVTRFALATLAAIALSTTFAPLRADCCTTTGNGGFETTLQADPNPATSVASLNLHVACSAGFTCGTTKIEVDWDDGSVTTQYVVLPIDISVDHDYGSSGLRHVKVTGEDEDENGNWFDIRGLDITIN